MEGECVAVFVDAGEGRAQFVEGGGAKAGERQLAAALEYAPGFGQRFGQVALLHGEAGPVEIDAGVA